MRDDKVIRGFIKVNYVKLSDNMYQVDVSVKKSPIPIISYINTNWIHWSFHIHVIDLIYKNEGRLKVYKQIYWSFYIHFGDLFYKNEEGFKSIQANILIFSYTLYWSFL